MMGILIILIIAAVLLAVSWRLASFVMAEGKRQTPEEAMAFQAEHYDVSFYEKLEKEDYTVPGHDGYLLHAELLKNPEKTDRYVILTHGYTDNRYGSLKYVPMYLRLGYNCIIYDLRGHGENGRTVTTYGILESKDLAEVVKDTRARYPELTQLGLHGESLGAATTVTYLRFQPEIDFAVSDCAFADLENILREGLRNAHMPGVLVDLAKIGIKIRYHYAMKDMRPVDALDENRIPILIIHGEADDLIRPHNAQDLYDRTRGKKELHLINGAGHAVSILTAPEEYEAYVSGFLRAIGK